jgi:RNA polymerase sigma-B factor
MTTPPARDPAFEQERELELFGRLPEDRDAREEIIELHAPLARYLASRFKGRGEAFEDLVQVAMVGLIKAVDRFDPTREVRFSTYASATVVGEIKRHFRDRAWALRVPRRLQETGLQVSKAVATLHQERGRSPTIGEIAERIGATEEEVREAMDAMTAYTADSLDAPAGDAEASSIDRLRADEPRFALLEEWESVAPALRDLPTREKTILYLRFFRGRTQSQIAEEVGISQMHVSRILTRTLRALRAAVEADGQVWT